MRERPGERHQLRRQHCRERVRVGGVLDRQHAAHARELRRLRGNRGGVRGAHRHHDLGALERARAADALGGAGVEPGAVVLGDDEDFRAHSRPFFFSAATSSAASLTRMPFCRCGGGSNFTSFSCRRGVDAERLPG